MEKSESGLNGHVESYLGMASITTSERTFETYPQFLQISIEAKGNTTAKNIYLRVCCAIKFEDETNKARSHIYIPTHRSECSTALLCSWGLSYVRQAQVEIAEIALSLVPRLIQVISVLVEKEATLLRSVPENTR